MDRFRFHSHGLQEALRRLYDAWGIPSDQGADGSLVCDDQYEAAAEALRSAVRYQRFPGWHTDCIASEPPADRGAEDEAYREAVLRYLAEHAVPHEIEEHNHESWLLLPDDEVVPDAIWESVYGPVSTVLRTSPACCFCQERIEGEAFGQLSVHQSGSSFRSVLYAHLDCLRGHVHPEALHIIDAAD